MINLKSKVTGQISDFKFQIQITAMRGSLDEKQSNQRERDHIYHEKISQNDPSSIFLSENKLQNKPNNG